MKRSAAMTVAHFIELIRRSQLLPDDQTQAIEARWQREASDAAPVAAFARWLVAQGYLTEYQTSQLIHGQLGALFLGPYELRDRIGRGNLAIVYRAAHRAGPVVALKVLPPSRAKDRNLLARFRNEAELACKLHHPNIVRAFEAGEAGEAGGVHFLVLEYLPGENLQEAIARRGPLPADEVVHVARQALEGLQYLHTQGLVHRNLEPANLMLAVPPGADARPTSLHGTTVKILDTSLSRSLFEESLPSGEQHGRLTFEGQILGTPEYLAPEQARDARSCDIRADLYSLGCILYHALTGTPPFHSASPVDVVIRQAVDQPRPLREVRADVPVELALVVERLLAKDPDERFANPAAASDALLGRTPPPAPPPIAAPLYAPVVLCPPSPPLASRLPQVGRDGSPPPNATARVSESPPRRSVEMAVPVAAPSVELDTLPVADAMEAIRPRQHTTNVWVYMILGALGLLTAQFAGWLVAYLRPNLP